MKGHSYPPSVPVEVHFEGCQADPGIMELCLDAACRLGNNDPCPDSCSVEVKQRGRLAEIRIILEATTEKFALARVFPAANAPQLRRSLGEAFDQMTQRLGEFRLHHPRVVGGAQKNSIEDDAPPCIWIG